MQEQEKSSAKKFIKAFAKFAVVSAKKIIKAYAIIAVVIVALNIFSSVKREVNMALNPYLYVDGSGSAGTFACIYFEDENIVAAEGEKTNFFSLLEYLKIYLKGLSGGETDVYIFVFNGGGDLYEVVHFKVHNYGTWMQVMRVEAFSIDRYYRARAGVVYTFFKERHEAR